MNKVRWALAMIRQVARVHTGHAGSFEESEAELRRLDRKYGVAWHTFDDEPGTPAAC